MKVLRVWFSPFPNILRCQQCSRFEMNTVFDMTCGVQCFCPKTPWKTLQFIKTLVISYNVQVLRSTITSCYEVFGVENSWLMPYAPQILAYSKFSNSPPWYNLSLTIFIILWSFSFWNGRHSFLKVLNIFDFSLKKNTQVKYESSYTITFMYFLPPMLSTCIGLMRSMCNNSRHTIMAINLCCLYVVLFVYQSDMAHKYMKSSLRILGLLLHILAWVTFLCIYSWYVLVVDAIVQYCLWATCII